MARNKNRSRQKPRTYGKSSVMPLAEGPTRVVVETNMGKAVVKVDVGPTTTLEDLCDTAIQVAFNNQPKFTALGPMFRTVEDLRQAARIRFPDLFPMEVDGDPDVNAAMQRMMA